MNKDVWLFPQNACNKEQFLLTIEILEKLNGIDRDKKLQELLMKKQSEKGIYNPYKKETFDISSANHKIDEPRFYGAIYETPNKKIHVSSYGKLLLKYKEDNLKRNKVFIGMLYNIQFDNPYKKMEGFNIYPLRLIFSLLLELKLEGYLTNLEVAFILYNIKNISSNKDYEKIIEDILKFRKTSLEDKIKRLKGIAEQFIKNFVSCNYMFNLLTNFEIISQINNPFSSFKLKSPVRKKETVIKEKIIKIENRYQNFIVIYNRTCTIYEDIKKLNGLKSDWIREVYNTIPSILLEELNEKNDIYMQFLEIPKLIVETSTNAKKWGLFEDYITKGFNLFSDLDAEKIGGAGEPDVLCHFKLKNTIFVADAKATEKKLGEINDGRLKQHRKKYNAKYTIVVTPKYTPSALDDINGTNTCVITSYCFADLISNYILKLHKNHMECSYSKFHELILNNLGKDISDNIYKIIDEKIGVDSKNI